MWFVSVVNKLSIRKNEDIAREFENDPNEAKDRLTKQNKVKLSFRSLLVNC